MASVILTNTSLTPTSLTIKCNQINTSYKKNNVAKPNANIDGPVEVQTQSFENPVYTVSGVHFLLSDTTTIQHSHLLDLLAQKYDGTNNSTLIVTYGDGSGRVLADSTGATSGIKVVLDSFSYPVDVSDSRNGYMPIGNIVFRETL
jgi:hypothetical protein